MQLKSSGGSLVLLEIAAALEHTIEQLVIQLEKSKRCVLSVIEPQQYSTLDSYALFRIHRPGGGSFFKPNS